MVRASRQRCEVAITMTNCYYYLYYAHAILLPFLFLETCPEFKYPRRITHMTVSVGQTVSLVCTVFHKIRKEPDYFDIWPRFNNTPMMYNYTYNIRKNQVLVMNYTIFHAHKNDSRSYSCTYKRLGENCNNLFKIYFLIVKGKNIFTFSYNIIHFYHYT